MPAEKEFWVAVVYSGEGYSERVFRILAVTEHEAREKAIARYMQDVVARVI